MPDLCRHRYGAELTARLAQPSEYRFALVPELQLQPDGPSAASPRSRLRPTRPSQRLAALSKRRACFWLKGNWAWGPPAGPSKSAVCVWNSCATPDSNDGNAGGNNNRSAASERKTLAAFRLCSRLDIPPRRRKMRLGK